MKLSDFGTILQDEWLKTSTIRKNVEIDEFVVMPNHFHGIFFITFPMKPIFEFQKIDEKTESGVCNTQRGVCNTPLRSPGQTVGAIVRGFKSAVTGRINKMRKFSGDPIFQRNYYEHVVRNDNDLENIREYIQNNPPQWLFDEENPSLAHAQD